ncbi:hypothetical protein [Rhodobacter sp. CZR27]|uniref:hypothetical protein n=1 Tax=Rhodobacter sp. CZR27 TaxID=2033869 RepID=UPI000BBF061B|nr:hypothetical protein [Rhodobacter sp. CZR27]
MGADWIRRHGTDILRIHAEDAAFLLTQRDLALETPNHRLIDIYDLEQRLQGHLDALVLAHEAGCETAGTLAQDDPSGPAAAVLLHVALRQQRPAGVEAALAAATDWRPMGHAAAWCGADLLGTVMPRWIASREPVLRWIAFDICGRHRVDPRRHLQPGLEDRDPQVRARAIRLAGEVGRADCRDFVAAEAGTEADIAAVLLGDGARAARLAEAATFPTAPGPARRAAELFPLALQPPAAQEATRALLGRPATRRWGIVALGALGSAQVLRWLADAMEDPLDARVAVSAFETITGVHVAHDGLERAIFPYDPENAAIDGDPGETLIEAATPWPDVERVRDWLSAHAARLPTGERLLFGLAAWTFTGPPEPWLRFQSRHRAVALTQAMRRPQAPLPNWRSPVRLAGGSFTRTW